MTWWLILLICSVCFVVVPWLLCMFLAGATGRDDEC